MTWHEFFEARDAATLDGARALLRLHGRLVRRRNRALREFALTSARLRILDVLTEYPDSNLSVIARRLDLSRQAVHRVLHDMVDIGLIDLHPDEHDRRAWVPVINDVGKVTAEFARRWQLLSAQPITAGYSLEQLQYARYLADRLWRALE